MDLKISGKRALVLGASSGLGHAIAGALINEGVEVAICSSHGGRIQAAAEAIGARPFTANLDEKGAGTRLVEEITAELGGIDILVTNSGPPPGGRFLEMGLDQWELTHQRVLLSALETIYAVIPAMQKNRWGRILLSNTFAIKEPDPKLTTSVGYRAALVAATKNLATDVATDGITVNALLPGYIMTESMKRFDLEAVKAEIPMGRLGDPSEYGALATFLASDLAGYITGQTHTIDGGMAKSW